MDLEGKIMEHNEAITQLSSKIEGMEKNIDMQFNIFSDKLDNIADKTEEIYTLMFKSNGGNKSVTSRINGLEEYVRNRKEQNKWFNRQIISQIIIFAFGIISAIVAVLMFGKK